MAQHDPGTTIVYDATEADLNLDQRLLDVFRLWRSKKRGDLLPARKDIALEELRPWLGNIILFDVVDGGRDFRYRLFGSKITRELGFDMTGKLLSDYPITTRLAFLFEVHREVLRRRCTALTEHNPEMPNVRRRRRLVLPFAADGATVDVTMTVTYAIELVREPDRYL